MTNEPDDALWSDVEHRLPLRELAELSGLSEADVAELVEYGALAPADSIGGQWVFSVQSIVVARRARRLREDYDLETHGVALVLAYLDRIRELEAKLRALEALLPR
jgi:chaperone modulatory protein CbpM